jgi:pimeloyl-ACP methyl ester carboxylesterase
MLVEELPAPMEQAQAGPAAAPSLIAAVAERPALLDLAAMTAAPPQFATVHWNGREHRIEYAVIGAERRERPPLVFLHEGLGSLSMWRDFPRALCNEARCRGIVLSRWGYGRSSPREGDERWPVEFMHQQAQLFLPAFFESIGLDAAHERPWFYGHSDGESIALIYAATFPDRVGGVVAAAPHIMVEDLTVARIEKAREAYPITDLRRRLARHHADPDSAFWGWNQVWLDPNFRRWSIEDLLPRIRCPVLAIQGVEDEYGTMAQVDGIAARVPQAELLKLERCGHAAHRDRPAEVIAAVSRFLGGR